MKRVLFLIDGAADLYNEEVKGTPLSVANKPNMDMLAANGEIGLCKTVPDGMSPGSDNANLSVMGYDPLVCYTGRSPLEAVSMGIELTDTSVTFRANVVTLSNEENYEDRTMVDYSSGEISTAESTELINAVASVLDTEEMKLFAGVSYRHCLVFDSLEREVGKLTPPHDISDKPIADHLPQDEMLLSIMKKSYEILKDHPVNKARIAKGKNPGNSLWLWGMGTKPMLDSYEKLYGVKAGMISAVDLLKGIGILGGFKNIEVEGATGNLETNFIGKAEAAIENLKNGLDFVYIHMEAPDECGHQGDLQGKIKSLEIIDRDVVGKVLDYLEECGEDFKVVVMPDHPTPIKLKTHTSEPVPYLYYSSAEPTYGGLVYNEENAKESGVYHDKGIAIAQKLFR
ncbi:MAG: cofactor-independent phosphoglycerate mutase [Bacillota bacterium]